jgi:hypothetical protein
MSGNYSTHTGMETYNRLLTEARVKGEAIGPEHYKHNRQFKQWLLRQKNLGYLEQAREAKKAGGEIRKALVSINQAKERIGKVAKEVGAEERLRQKHAELQRQKIASGYKVVDRMGIKSVGNGL